MISVNVTGKDARGAVLAARFSCVRVTRPSHFRCGNMARIASASISVLNLCRSRIQFLVGYLTAMRESAFSEATGNAALNGGLRLNARGGLDPASARGPHC